MEFLGKVRSMVSFICGLMQWLSRTTSLPSPMQTPKESPSHHSLQPDVVVDHHSSKTSSLSPSESSCSDSVAFWSSSKDEMIITILTKDMEKQRFAVKRDYPPPIPPLAYGNLRARMPYVLTRHYGDGKLVLRVGRVKHHGYFEARKENGRLVLNLLTLGDKCCHGVCEDSEDREVLEDHLQTIHEDIEYSEEKMEEDDQRKEYEETVMDFQGRLDGYAAAIEVAA
ncbi:hypothetical protein FH972_015930 [Carpinus fangiana]|uniref:FAF domain-containing protein n=1 Tax=Carpinus fangiana TaxID=176857 RepID=A0A5N6REV0_9ROSI|nr:hypothetical protein FH972_015930 [Carpinus fangiana]